MVLSMCSIGMSMADAARLAPHKKFTDPDVTANGERRARVALDQLRTLWINTGSLCNIDCRNCYIESSPENDRLAYITRAEVGFLSRRDRARTAGPHGDRLHRRRAFHEPRHPRHARRCACRRVFGAGADQCHAADAAPAHHDGLACASRDSRRPPHHPREPRSLFGKAARDERSEGAFDKTIEGIDWLAREGFALALAGRTYWGESEADMRDGYAALIAARRWPIDANDPAALVLFPEMDARADVPEITAACWGILGKSPSDVMCASSRMVVKRKGAARAGRAALHAAPLRSRLRDGRDAWPKPRAPMAACSTTARSSSAIRTAPSSACSAAAPARRKTA